MDIPRGSPEGLGRRDPVDNGCPESVFDSGYGRGKGHGSEQGHYHEDSHEQAKSVPVQGFHTLTLGFYEQE